MIVRLGKYGCLCEESNLTSSFTHSKSRIPKEYER